MITEERGLASPCPFVLRFSCHVGCYRTYNCTLIATDTLVHEFRTYPSTRKIPVLPWQLSEPGTSEVGSVSKLPSLLSSSSPAAWHAAVNTCLDTRPLKPFIAGYLHGSPANDLHWTHDGAWRY
jgi:hypothetical protein